MAGFFQRNNLIKTPCIECAACRQKAITDLRSGQPWRQRIRLSKAKPARQFGKVLTAIVVSAVTTVCSAKAGSNGVKGKVRCPDEVATTAFYRNYSYGFSIWIPNGLKGYWNSAKCVKEERDCVCMGDHGRFIPIDRYSYLQVFVGVQNTETIRESINEEIESIMRSHSDKKESVEVMRRARSRLGGIPGTEVTFRYPDAKSGKTMFETIIICPPPADRSHGGFLYTVTLSAPEKYYSRRKSLYWAVKRSWKFRPSI